MKKIYIKCLLSCICLLVSSLISHETIAQNVAEVHEGKLRIKIVETTASFLQATRMSQTSDGYLKTGNAALDGVLQQSKATSMKRVFRHAGKFEAKHRAHGLHLWYEVSIGTDVKSAVSSYRDLKQVQVSEAIYKKEIVGYDRTMESLEIVPLPSAPNDPQFGNQWHYDNTGQTGGTAGADISLLDAWNVETGNSQVIVAVTDGGIDVDHEDLSANMWVNTAEIPGNGIDDDGNGYIDDINGYGFGDNTGDIAAGTHGTHVGGTVAAVSNNGIGVSGVAGGDGPGNGVRLMSCAAFGAVGTGGFEETYTYGADNGAVISQNSWGYTNPGVFEQVVLDAIDYFIAEAGFDEFGVPDGPMQGGLVVFAAGNDAANDDRYPGFYDPTFAVGGTDHNDDQYIFSNRGDWVDVAAPAVSVLSTFPNDAYGLLTGTSMACPHVSGLAALVVSRNINNITPTQVRFLIETTTDPLPGLEFLGSGRINAFSALQVDDSDGPISVVDLSVTGLDLSSITLQWTAPSDVGSVNASSYDIRYSTSLITSVNFDAATAVASPPTPATAGTTENFTVTGLASSTEYYFAIKSEDFFNNLSDISNVATATTNDVPVASVTPGSLTSNLITAESEVQNLTIDNSGLGSLDFNITITGDAFLTADITNGTVAASGNQPISLTFDANGLFGGTYLSTVVISTNDPANATINVVATLNVTGTGTPIITVSPASITFADTFIGGTDTNTISITNDGTEILDITGITSSSVDFVVTSSSVFTLLPFESQDVSVEFNPTVLGALSGSIDIASNDTATPLVQVAVSGNGVDSPSIQVAPTFLEAELLSGEVTTEVLTITNNGVANLEFSAAIAAEEETTSAININIPAKLAGKLSSANTKQKVIGNSAGMQLTSNVSLSADIINVMLLTADDDISDVESTLSAFPDLNVTRFPKASLPGISITDFDGIDLVLTTNNTQWLAAGNISPVVIGDLLADFIDNGGKVIVNSFAYDYGLWALAGRFVTDSYGPFTAATVDFNGTSSLGTIHEASHPIMDGVATIGNSYLWQDPALAAGATLIADWSDGNHFAAANDNVVALNILPSNGTGAAGWTGDLATLYHNSIVWLSGGVASFVSIDLENGILAQGESVNINVTISAEGLNNGVYESGIEISSNDPSSSLVEVPVTLTVLGPPVTASPESLESTLEKGQTETQIVTLTNNSDSEASYEVAIEDATVASVTTRINEPLAKRTAPYTGVLVRTNSTAAIISNNAVRLSTEQYATNFESFALGDVNGQDGWVGQFANWTIGAANPSDGSQNFRGLADGFGQALAFTPEVPVGSDALSSFSAMVQIQGSGVTWQIIPQSTTAELVNTRLQFNGDGSIDVLAEDGAGGSFQTLPVTTPSGYFSVGIEIERATSQFTVYIDGVEVYSALGFAGDIEQVAILSLMETAGPTFDMDEVQIIDGGVEVSAPYLTVNPESGTIPVGSSVQLDVTFDATEQDFGSFTSNIVVTINGGVVDDLVIPATLNVVGDPSIFVDPTVVQEVVDYNVMSTRTVTIENTGGSPLDYDLTVIGADIGVSAASQISDRIAMATTASAKQLDSRVSSKLNKDIAQSLKVMDKPKALYVTIGETVFNQDFEGGTFPPTGWNVIDNEGTGIQWANSVDAGESNYSGSGEAATVSSDAFGAGEFDTELISPVINIAGMSNLSLKYNVNYQNFANLDFLDLDVSIDGGTTWTNVLSWNEDHGTFRGLPGEEVNISLDGVVAGADEMIIRWHYYDPNIGDSDWYAQIDDVEVIENTEVWLALDQSSGTVPVGETAEVELLFDPTVVNPGFYVAGIIVNSNAANTPVVGVVVSMQELNGAEISVDPDSLEMELVAGRTGTQTLTISNSGESALNFAFDGNFPNVGVAASSSSRESKEKTLQTAGSLTGAHLIQAPFKNVVQNALEPPVDFSDMLYATNFEDFTTGDINGQLGWSGQFGNWAIDTSNPAGGAQHMTSLSDGLGQTLAFSPEVSVGTESVSSTSMMVDLKGTDVTWQIIPQSISEALVVTRLSFNPDGTASALVDVNGGELQPITTAIPEGQFQVAIEVERATSVFTVYFDEIAVFSGTGFSGSIEQMVLLSLMEVAGASMDIDNLQIVDGIVPELVVSVSPQAGTVPAGDTQDVIVRFDATNLLGGIYHNDLVISSNDPLNEKTIVPTTLTVIDPQVIAINPDSLVEILTKGEMSTQILTVSNDGVADLDFVINIEGELVLPTSNDHQFSTNKDWQADSRIVEKASRDNGPSSEIDASETLVKQHGMVALVYEDFEGATFPPADWTVIDNEGTGVEWAFSADYNEGNYTGSGEAATVSSDDTGTVEFDTELRTPSIAVNGAGLTLEYAVNYQNFAGLDFLDVDISTDNGTTWTTMLSWNEDHGSLFAGPGEIVSIDLDSYLVGAATFMIRWHYYDPNTGDFDWYAQIDDVVIGVPWLSLSQASGTIPGGSSVDIEVNFDATVLDPGLYTSNLSFCSNDLKNPEVDVPVYFTVLTPANILLDPDTIQVTLYEGFEDDASFMIGNDGETTLEYNVSTTPDFVEDLTPEMGEVAQGENTEVLFNITAEGLIPGSYVEAIHIDSNDPDSPSSVVIDLTVLEFIVLDMEVEAVCSENPDETRAWKITNPNDFEWDAFWFIIGSSQNDDVTLTPGDNYVYTSTLNDRPNTFKLRWLNEDEQVIDIVTESISDPCEVLDLSLTTVCSNNPIIFRRWNVSNPNSFTVAVNWTVIGTSQSGMLYVAGDSDTFFYTEAITSANTASISWVDENGDTQDMVTDSSGELCDIDNSCAGGEVIVFNQGNRKNGKSISSQRSMADKAIGMPEQGDGYNFVSLGFGGEIVIRLNNIIADQPGNDFTLVETSFNDLNKSCTSYPETADVYVSTDGIEFYFVGTACKDTEFDISVSGLMDIEYVKIQDTSDPLNFRGGNADGFDVDGIACINAHYSKGTAFRSASVENNVPDEPKDDDAVSAWPNPFKEALSVKMNVPEDGKYEVRVYNIFGSLMYHKEISSTGGTLSDTIDTKDLAKGTYTIVVFSGKNKVSSEMLIKR